MCDQSKYLSLTLISIHNNGMGTSVAELDRAHQKPTKTPEESDIRQHTVCDNRKEGINIKFKVIGPNKKHRNTPPNQETGLYSTTGTV